MLLKLVGCALLIAGGSCLGIYYGIQPRLRSRDLEEIKKGLMVMYSETEYGHTCLEPMCIKAGEITSDKISGLFKAFAISLSERCGESSGKMWEECIIGYDGLHLSENDISMILGLGSYLGCGDIKRQLTGIELLTDYIDRCQSELRDEIVKRMRLCRSTGILAGLFLVILLF